MSGYPQSLKYYIWGFQVYFRVSCETSASSLFDHFDRGLLPHVFLLGLSDKKEPTLCFDPEDHDIYAKDFKKFKKILQHFLDTDPDRNMMYSGPGMQEEMDGRRQIEAARKAIEKLVSDSPHNTGKRQYFCSKPVSIGGYHVFVLLGLIKEVYQLHQYLKKSTLDDGRMRISKSLLESAIDVYLKDKEQALYFANPGKSLSDDYRATDELLRTAARKFLYTIGSKGGNISGMHGLFDNCNHISTYKYEKTPNTGHLIIARNDNPMLNYYMKLKESFPLSDLRKTRKMLELSDARLGVISDAEKIFGLGFVSERYNAADENIFHIHFQDTYCWQAMHAGKIVLQMKYGLPEFPSEVINRTKFEADLRRVFKGIVKSDVTNLYRLAVAATAQNKGAMLVIVEDAEEESARLQKQSLVLVPLKLNPESVLKLSSIDGGILLNTKGIAYAHGVILDGVVGKSGNSSRGSRYNSAKTYHGHRGSKKPTFLVIVSEDGMVDLVPDLRPQVKHSEIKHAIAALEELLQQSPPDMGDLNRLMDYFSARRFYLRRDECTRINRLRKKIEKKQGFVTVRIVHKDLKSNPDMNASYYLPE